MRTVPSPTGAIASPSNPRIKATARLRDRRGRDETGLTLVDGAREVRRALESSVDVVEAFICEPLLSGEDARAALDALAARDIPTTSTTQAAFSKLAFGDRADGLIAVLRIPSMQLNDLGLPEDPLVVVVEGVEKPGNLGAVLRSADGAGADALIAASPRTDLFNPNAIRASAGTIFSVPMAAAPTRDVLDWLRRHAIRIIAARVDADVLYTDTPLVGPLALTFGSEADGLTDAWRADDIAAVRLPMRGVADSLNVSVSAAVVLYEARRQRDAAWDSAH
jgi:RNA methyltransferase, TrmH family